MAAMSVEGAPEAPQVPSRKDHLHKAREMMPSLRKLVDMKDADFASDEGSKKALHEALNVPARAMQHNSKNDIKTVKGLRNAKQQYHWIDLRGYDAAERLLDTKVACVYCLGKNQQIGVCTLNMWTLKMHEDRGVHKEAAAAAIIQPDLTEYGLAVVPRADRARLATVAVFGSLMAGGDKAAGLPLSAIPELLNQDFFRLMPLLRSGCPGKTSLTDSVLPDAIKLVKARIAALLEGKQFAIGIDGGSSHLADHAKVLAITAISPELEYDLVLDIKLLRFRHENAEIQAKAIDDIVTSMPGISKAQVQYLVADNASLNPKTAKVCV